MSKHDKLELLAKQLRNAKAKKWRDNNKEKVREINHRYWLKKAQLHLQKKEAKSND